MTITFPDDMREELEQKAKVAGFVSIEMYLAELVHADEGPSLLRPSGEARYSVNTREELEAKLLEGISSAGDVVAGPDFWETRRSAAEKRASSGEPR